MAGYTMSHLLTHQPVPDDGILTRQLFDDDRLRMVLFTFSAGQQLSEHTAGTTALLHFVSGEATVTLGQDSVDAVAGTLIRMEPGLAHSVVTKSSVIMLLVLLERMSTSSAIQESPSES